jgi:hypothetical protein
MGSIKTMVNRIMVQVVQVVLAVVEQHQIHHIRLHLAVHPL